MSAKNKLEEFRPQSRNANKHNPRGLGLLENSIRKDGFIGAMTAANDGEIIAGSARLEKSAEVFGVEAEPIVVETDGSRPIIVKRTDIASAGDERAKRLAIADNRVQEVDLTWDAEVLHGLAEFDDLDLGEWFSDKELKDIGVEFEKPEAPEPQTDRAEELRAKWGVELGQLWQLGEHRLICGDCTDAEVVARVTMDSQADCIFTSPPYAVGVDYDEYEDTIDNLRSMLPVLSKQWLNFVIDGGFVVINFGDVASGRDIAETDEPCEYPMAVEYWPIFRESGWLLWSRRIWCKPNPRVHSPWCIQSNRAATDWEHLWTWRKPGKPIVKRIDGEFSSAKGWYLSSLLHGVDEGKSTHGAGMALGIAEWMISIHSRNDRVVLEPFNGTGTTLIACERLNRKCRAVEISPAYVAVALERWHEMTGQMPELLD